MNDNLLLLTDSYKVSHYNQYPPGTTLVESYFESRGSDINFGTNDPYTVFFGLQYLIKRYLLGSVVTREGIDRAAAVFRKHFGRPDLFNRSGWEQILTAHGGRLPVRIRAVAEGTPVGIRNVVATISNTDPAAWWLPNYLETLLVQLWYPMTVATISREAKRLIQSYAEATGDPSLTPFKLHDFGCRGVSSMESAGIGGLAHLVNFLGTDTLPALEFADRYYDCDMAGFSIPATEHSTITSWGDGPGELDAFRHWLRLYPDGIIACVSDSYDIERACRDYWGEALRAEVLARDGVLVVRPDSGDPATIVVRVLELLGAKFGTTTNAKGYRLLPPKVRVIQGDGVNLYSIGEILASMKAAGWSSDNVAFGMGGALLQKVNRDTFAFAFKCNRIVVNGVERMVYKAPTTDTGKRSKGGRLKLVRLAGEYKTLTSATDGVEFEQAVDLQQDVFLNGDLLQEFSLEDVRTNSRLE